MSRLLQHLLLLADKQACIFNLRSAFSGLRQFLAAECPLKMTKNAFYFTSKTHFVLMIFEFLS